MTNEISDAELGSLPRMSRKEAMSQAIASANIEGIDFFPEHEEIIQDYVNGKISADESIRLFKEHLKTLPSYNGKNRE
ncbi:hypothetical protein FAI40_10425 (plasmid) [Acetobacteraceae bacterium]|nr:hypothetical protein FAI40_10425 [Acetobacteraceae bacterium]